MVSSLRIASIFLFFILHTYWRIKHKGLTKVFDFGKNPLKSMFHKSFFSYSQVLVLLQLGGFDIFPLTNLPSNIGVAAFALELLGLTICISARQVLGKSWVNAKDYQKSRSHKLVTSGIYHYVRHPIYLGLNLMITGAEILAESYLVLFLPLLYLRTYNQARKEEKYLLSRLGNKYNIYRMTTGIFFPQIRVK